MADFIPTNSLEIALRTLLRDKTTPVWSFFTPLATAQLFVIAKDYPELDGSDAVAPKGGNPEVCCFSVGEESWIGVYTSADRARQAMEVCKVPAHGFTRISAQGHGLLGYLSTLEVELWINAGLVECQYHLDPDLVSLLLQRPEPPPPAPPTSHLMLNPDAEAPAFFAPLRDFLEQQPAVRAAWVFEGEAKGTRLQFEVGLVAVDPQDHEILQKVRAAVTALTPVEIDAVTTMLMADDTSLGKLARDQRPFYRAPGFLAEGAH